MPSRLTDLAKIKAAATPVVSVYLNTRWADEQQRERARVYLKNQIRQARRAGGPPELAEDLDWIESQGESLIGQQQFPEADGVALFACRTLGLREVIPARAAFEDTFVIGDTPFLRPLAALLEESPAVLVVFVDGESARFIPLTARGAGEEVALESEIPGRHRRGGWAQLAQSRYQRHIQDHRGRHFEAVAEAVAQLAGENRVERIVLAGEPRIVSAFRKHVRPEIAGRIAATVPAARHEPASAIVGRAVARVAEMEAAALATALDALLTEAAKGGRAVAGVEGTLDAASQGAIQRLYMLKGFREPGRVCVACGALQPGESSICRRCGKETKAVELGEALVDRVLDTGGKVEMIGTHAGLAGMGGVAARLRYPL